MIHPHPTPLELDGLQRKAHAARRALQAVRSEARAALQLVAQLDDEIGALRRGQTPSQPPQEAQRHAEDQNPTHALA